MSASAIYSALAAVDVTFRAAVVPAKWGVTLPTTLNAPDLPLRLLLPWRSAGSDARDIRPATMGGSGRSVELIIQDTFMFKRLDKDTLEAHIAALYEYEAAYDAAIAQRVALVKPNAVILSWSIGMGMSEYPVRSGVEYSSCICEVRVKELRA